jgi:hypothetical protein
MGIDFEGFRKKPPTIFQVQKPVSKGYGYLFAQGMNQKRMGKN